MAFNFAGFDQQLPETQNARIRAAQAMAGNRNINKKSFWTDQISTVGGIAGGILGAPLGILGAGGGAAIGSGLGEALENIMTGQRTMDNVGKEAAIAGAFGVGPIRAAKGLAGGAKALIQGSDDVLGVAGKAATTPLRQKAGKALVGRADDLAVKQFRLTPTQLKNFNQKFKEDAGTVIRRYGFQSADDIAAKGIEPLQQQFDSAIGAIPGVTKESLKKTLMGKIDKLAKAGPSDTKQIGAQLKKEADTILKEFGDVVDAKELNIIRRQFDDLVNYSEKIANPSRYGVNKRMADAIRETLQKADPSGSLKQTGHELQKLRQLADNVAKQGQLGRGSLPFGLGLTPGAVFGSAGGPAGAVAGMASQAVANSKVARRLVAGGASKLGGKLASSGSNAVTPINQGVRGAAAGLISTLGNQAPQQPSLEDALMAQSFDENSMNAENAMTPSTNMPNNVQNMGEQYQTEEGMSSGITRESALQAMLQDIQLNGGKNIDKIMAIYEFANPEPKESKGLNSTAAGTVTDLTNGIANIRQLGEKFSTSGANKPVVGEFLAGNPFNNDARNLRADIARVKQVIGKALEGGVLRKEDEAKYAKILPTLNDNDEQAQYKIQAIADDLERKLYLYQQNVGTGSLEDALLQFSTQGQQF